MFAAEAGYVGFDVKVKENAVAARNRCPAWDVFVREVGATRGKKVGTMLIAACEAFGPYHY
jgi:hypothetical protein